MEMALSRAEIDVAPWGFHAPSRPPPLPLAPPRYASHRSSPAATTRLSATSARPNIASPPGAEYAACIRPASFPPRTDGAVLERGHAAAMVRMHSLAVAKAGAIPLRSPRASCAETHRLVVPLTLRSIKRSLIPAQSANCSDNVLAPRHSPTPTCTTSARSRRPKNGA